MHFVAIFVSHLFSRQTPVLIYTQGYIYFTHIYVIYIFGNELERILDLFEGVFICFCFFFLSFQIKRGNKKKENEFHECFISFAVFVWVNNCYDDDDDGDHKHVEG